MIGSRSTHSSILWRAAYIVCVLLVFSYVLFDLLDVDGSDFPPLKTLAGKFLIVPENGGGAHDVYVVDQPSPEGKNPLQGFGESRGHQLHGTELQRFSPLDSARAHGYRVGLPRDSISHLSLSI
jgi:hypothetical protein